MRKLKLISSITIGIILLFFILLFSIPSILKDGKFKAYTTYYSKDFSYEKLESIRKGMTEEDVKQILGEPLYVSENTAEGIYTWGYSKAKTSIEDFVGFESVRLFFKDKKVTSVGKNYFF